MQSKPQTHPRIQSKGESGKPYHFIDLGRVELLDVPQDPDVVVPHKVDGHALAAVAPRSADAVDVELARVGQVIVDDQGDLQIAEDSGLGFRV